MNTNGILRARLSLARVGGRKGAFTMTDYNENKSIECKDLKPPHKPRGKQMLTKSHHNELYEQWKYKNIECFCS